MRHRKKFNHLSRTSSHRKAMLSNMAASLIMHKRIRTTVAKAKALRVYVEPLITRSKEDTTHQRRMVFRKLQNKVAVAELFREVSMKVADRPGGYTRIIKLGKRLGDNAEMCMIELVDFNENLLSDGKKITGKAKTTRRRGRKKSQDETTQAAVASTDQTSETEADAPEAVAESTEEIAEATETKDQAETEPKVVTEEAEPKEETEAKQEEPEAAAEVVAEVEAKQEEPEAAAEKSEEEKTEEVAAEPEAKTEEKPAEEEKKETPEAKKEEEAKEDTEEDPKDEESKK